LIQYAAWILENEGIPVSRIYAFQAPNSGDVNYKKSVESRFKGRFSNVLSGEDLTPHIPPVQEASTAFAAAVLAPISGLMQKLSKSGGKVLPLGLNAKSPFVADHGIDLVLCSLLRGLGADC
jgi:hypothetical protein